jgi:hypothetical protein
VPDRTGVVAEVANIATDVDANIVDFEIVHSPEGDRGVFVMLVPSGSVAAFRRALLAAGYRPSVHAVEGGPPR